ncbi:Protein CBG10588 [Caenorhabditis briggsae]|uniref:Protein CBG10588 n=1 Tax=Caenorhabditis briggsae TaxID=6238 RepID=A8XBF3_CAEBR|nr:Protein CBG10588 [Caenorhabditis briggsae]CAP29968.1 Protein CBG10588 [Caenorhabditis briggsae]
MKQLTPVTTMLPAVPRDFRVLQPRILRYDSSLRCQSEQSDRVLRSDQRSKREGLSFCSSIQYVCKPDSLNGANGKFIVHVDPIVLAPRGLIRSIYYELQYMPSEGSVVFEKQIDGRYALNKNVKLVF